MAESGRRPSDVDAVVRRAAMGACSRGWFVFPVRAGGKEPRPGLSWPRAATGDPGRLALARWRPGENYGIAAKPSGLVVVDLDQPKPGYEFPPGWRGESGVSDGADVLAVLAERAGVRAWPLTFTVATPSGGRHLYFAAPPGRPIGNKPLGPLIDVRGGGAGDGGYVLGPGSVLPGGEYAVIDDQPPAPLPEWIADLLDPPPVLRRPQAVELGGPGGSRYAESALRAELHKVLTAAPGSRNNTLHTAAFSLGQLVEAGALPAGRVEALLSEAGERAGLPSGEVARTVASGIESGRSHPRGGNA